MNRYKILVKIFLLSVQIPLMACIITIVNDSNEPIMAVEEKCCQGITIAPGTQSDIGTTEKHANFFILTPSSIRGTYMRRYHIIQHTCGGGKPLFVRMSELDNNTYDTNYFVVELYTGQTSESQASQHTNNHHHHAA